MNEEFIKYQMEIAADQEFITKKLLERGFTDFKWIHDSLYIDPTHENFPVCQGVLQGINFYIDTNLFIQYKEDVPST